MSQPRPLRIGLCPLPNEPFWIQVEAAIQHQAHQHLVELVPLGRDEALGLTTREGPEPQAEELLALELKALIGWTWSVDLAQQTLGLGLPIIHLSETALQHPLSVSLRGLSEGARQVATHLAETLAGTGQVLGVGGLVQAELGDTGQARLAAIEAILARYPAIHFRHIACEWAPHLATPQLRAALQGLETPFDAILGLSDGLALAARDVSRDLNLFPPSGLLAGLNGEPDALAAIARHEMLATAMLFPEELGTRALEAACQATLNKPPAATFESPCQLVTARNITDVMADRILAMASLPTWLSEANQRGQQHRVDQLKASLEIISRIQSTLDSHRQLREIVELICAEHGYDRAKIYRWVEDEQRLFLVHPSQPGPLDTWYDLTGGSWNDVLGQLPSQATGESKTTAPGSLIIADGLGNVGDWYDLSGTSANSVIDQMAVWATPEAKIFAQAFEARFNLRPSPTTAGLSYDYASMWIHIAQHVWRTTGELSRATLADFAKHKLLTGEWSYTGGCMMREYKYRPDTVPDPVIGPHYFTFSVLEYLDGEGTVIFPSEDTERDLRAPRAWPAAPEPAPTEPPTLVFRLGVMGPYSGYNALVGAEMKGAVEMAFEKAGYRVGPYRIELIWIDCQSDAALAAEAYEKAIVEQGIQAGLLNWHTRVALACMEVAARHKTPHFFGLAGAGAINTLWRSAPDKYFYWVKGWPEPAKLTANYVQALEAAIARGLWQPEAKTAAFWGEDSEWGRSFVTGMKSQLESAGWQIVAEDYFPLSQTDFIPWFTKIKAMKPALLAGTGSNPTTYSAFVKQARTLGLERMFSWSTASQPSIPLGESDILGRALLRNEPVYIPYRPQTDPLPPDAAALDTRARLVLPIRHGETVLGVLDLRSRRATWHTRLELVSLQVLADQLGFAIREAQLYGRAAQAKARAERSDRSKTQLLANVSHELRTPLNVILGYTRRALDSLLPYHAALPAALVTDLERIHHSSEHLLHMANDLLDLSRAEIQELELFPRLIEPRPLLAEAFQSLAEAAPAGLTCWRLELPDHLPPLKADPVRLRQIVFNLLSNAQRFTDRGHITLGAEVAPPHLHLWVQDTGLGIPLDRQRQIFEPFVTAQHGDRQREGTGLGLSIVYQLVTLHQGTLTLESQPGEGSTFHIYLPLPGIEAEGTPLPPMSKRVLLLVSDNNQTPAEVARYCQRQGLRLRPIGPTESLNRILAEVEPAALAWNLGCAQPNYKALIERLCSHPALCRLPFMIYGAGLAETKTDSLGLTNFMLKPVEAKALLQVVEAMQPTAARSVLIVDDDTTMRTYLSQVLAQACLGFEIHTAEDGAAALVQMTHALPDLVILDLKMPGLDGFQVLESMRSKAKTSRIPVLVMTGQSLTMQDVKRLEHYALVTVHSKGLLTTEELAAAVHHSLFGAATLPPQTSALAKRAIAYFHEHYAEPLTRKEVAQAIGVSQNYLSQIFRQELGLSPWDYLTRYRIKQAEQLLAGTTESISAIANRVGFGDPAYFSRVFRAETGTSPSAFRRN